MSILPPATWSSGSSSTSSSGGSDTTTTKSSANNTTWLPPATWITTAVAPRSTINDAAEEPGQYEGILAAAGTPLPVIYGRCTMDALVANFLFDPFRALWVIQCVWGEGEIEAVEAIRINDTPLPINATVTHYLGTPDQTVNSSMVLAAAVLGVTYTDALPNVAYSVVNIPSGHIDEFPRISAVVRGRKLYDPRTTLTAYSTNPALALADLLSNSRYGGGQTVDMASVTAAANACDEDVGGAPRRTLNLALLSRDELYSTVEVLRTYAGCFVSQSDTGLRLIPDRPGFPARHYDHADGAIAAISPLRKAPLTAIPTVMRVTYAEVKAIQWREGTVNPWTEGEVIVYADGVLAGTTPRRESSIALPGIQSKAQATREATERLNKLTLCDLSFDLEVFDEGVELEVGDIVTVTHPVGLAAKPMRLIAPPAATGPGRYRLSLLEYDGAAYSDAVVSDPSYPDTNLPQPGEPVAPADLAVVEELVQLADGTWTSRLRSTWSAPEYPFVSSYRVTVKQGATLWATGTVLEAETLEWVTPPVKEGLGYTVEVVTISRIGVASSAASTSITAVGKLLPPTDVSSLSATVAADGLHAEWSAAGDIDLKGYEIRIGADWETGDPAWTGAATRAVLPLPVPGAHTLWIKALDRSGNESVGPATTSIVLSAPGATTLEAAVVGADVILSWAASSGTLALSEYELRYGADWATGIFITRLSAQSLRLPPNWTGGRTFHVRAYDAAGIEGAVGSATLSLSAPSAPSVTSSITASRALLSWDVPASTLPVTTYEVRYGANWASGTYVARLSARSIDVPVTWGGTREFLVAAIDAAGNVGAAGSASVVIAAPIAPVVSAEVVDNNVLLRWSDAKGSIEVASYEIRRGATWATAAVKGVQAGRFSALFESVGGTFTYQIRATDAAGNVGPVGQVVASVSQPPDFFLNYDQDSAFAGTKSKLIVEDGVMVGPVNTTETWETHFTARSWTTPQNQIDAGYPIFVQPAASPGYYEEVIDYGTTIGSTMITLTIDREDVSAGVTITPTISVSNSSATGPWTDYAGLWQALGTNFRWAKVRLDITGSTSALVKLSRLNIRMAMKLSEDAGMGYAAAADSGGTIVLFNKAFVDVQSITVTPQGTTAAVAIYDFLDAPNPTQFKVLLFNSSGSRISGNFSWSAKGV